ncbi:YciI family protein [Parapedobacter soli]|uniref:YciI family protein n=1 Tax=Parapedobacter soli TaxID=416955 RepID=UPI0021C7B0D4|nr:YciI family protein [Parapedobacter soli]
MNEYLLVIHRDLTSDQPRPTAEQMKSALKPYQHWVATIADQNKLVAPPKRWDTDGRVIQAKADGLAISEGPLATGDRSIGGLFLVKADNYEDAVELAKACPIIQYGAVVEVRMAVPTA